MNTAEILKHVDHTLLKPVATWEDIQKICDESIEYNTASICIPACYISRINEKYGDKVNICTVVGFPVGYSTTEAKVLEAKQAVGDKILKVIIETCFLTEEEKIAMCKCVTDAKADYIKTSTGFGTAGATIEDIKLFKQHIGENVKIKAAGGVKTVEDLEMFINEGCERIGTSSAINLIKGKEAQGY